MRADSGAFAETVVPGPLPGAPSSLAADGARGPQEASTAQPKGPAELAETLSSAPARAGPAADEEEDRKARPLAEARRVGRYELIEELGRGGMGAVYRARDLELGREVALKVIHTLAPDPEELQRFRREAQLSATLSHPNLVAVYDSGVDEGRPYLVMELVRGDSLKGLVRGGGAFEPTRAAELIEGLARALHHAHEHGVLHRDVKPANVLVDAKGAPKLTDFGLAKSIDVTGAGLTVTGQVVGTPAYMPPEQARGDLTRIDARADVYSLGATLYELLVGVPPFQGGSVMAVLAAVFGKDPVPPRSMRPELDRELETICLVCLEKEPARRYASAAALADDLGRHLRGEPTRARPLGPLGRAAKWIRRHPIPVAAGLVVATSLGVAGAREVLARQALEARSVQLQRANDELNRAIEAEKRSTEEAQQARRAAQSAAQLEREARERAEQSELRVKRQLKAMELCVSATEAFVSKRYDEAVQRYDEALALDPTSSEAYRGRAHPRMALGDYEGAAADCRAALDAPNPRPEIYTMLAEAETKLGNLPAALEAIDQLVALVPGSSFVHRSARTSSSLSGTGVARARPATSRSSSGPTRTIASRSSSAGSTARSS